MTMMDDIADGFSRWIDCVAGALVRCREHLRSPRTVRLLEQDAGEFTIQMGQRTLTEPQPIAPVRMADGRVTPTLPPDIAAILPRSRVEIILQSNRFLFRPVYLPARAVEFLDGIVRAQIDRLTPWTPADAAFGFSQPVAVEPEQILITIAATSLALVAPYVEAMANAGAHSIAVFAAVEGSGDDAAAAIRVLEGGAHGIAEVRRVRRGLVATLAGAAIAAAGALCLAAFIGPGLENRRGELSEQMTRLRAAASATRAPEAGTFSALVRRKQSVPATVLVLEELSQILPDHTSLTELHVENDKVRITGIANDAASLIGLLEQSSRFAEATFFAPTTRTASEPGERFHIEARVHIGPRS
jgi:general secretion pathway protein L